VRSSTAKADAAADSGAGEWWGQEALEAEHGGGLCACEQALMCALENGPTQGSTSPLARAPVEPVSIKLCLHQTKKHTHFESRPVIPGPLPRPGRYQCQGLTGAPNKVRRTA